MLINFSNHPSDKWPDEQRQAAIDRFGSIDDMAFPHIDPLASETAVADLTQKYAAAIVKKLNNPPAPFVKGELNAVHIMGEMTFTCALVRLLHQRGITCVASTTERIAQELPDGSKKVTFQFCRFREYVSS